MSSKRPEWVTALLAIVVIPLPGVVLLLVLKGFSPEALRLCLLVLAAYGVLLAIGSLWALLGDYLTRAGRLLLARIGFLLTGKRAREKARMLIDSMLKNCKANLKANLNLSRLRRGLSTLN